MCRFAPAARVALLFAGAVLGACSTGEAPVPDGPANGALEAGATEAGTPESTAPSPADSSPSPSPGPPPTTVGGIVAAWTDVDGVVADLLLAVRREGRLTVTIRFRNTSEATRRLAIPGDYDSDWRLVAGGRDWRLAREADGDPLATEPLDDRVLLPGQTALWRGTFVAPPPGVHAFRLEVPGVEPFEDVPIADRE